MGVTFETKVWENDWRYVLETDYLESTIRRCNYNFEKINLLINNVVDEDTVRHAAQKIKNKGIIDSFYFVSDYAEKVLDYFDIDEESFKGGYNYSIAELTGLYLCESDYLLHFSSDSHIMKRSAQWIQDSLDYFASNKNAVVANPVWGARFKEAKSESFDEIDNFYLGYGFSDQCYMVPTAVFKKRIYNESHPASERYPTYGGELFEKRVDSYMRNHKLYRITNKNSCYKSKNWPKLALLKRVSFLMKTYLKFRLIKY